MADKSVADQPGWLVVHKTDGKTHRPVIGQIWLNQIWLNQIWLNQIWLNQIWLNKAKNKKVSAMPSDGFSRKRRIPGGALPGERNLTSLMALLMALQFTQSSQFQHQSCIPHP